MTASRSRGVVLAEGDFLNCHILDTIGISLQLVDIQDKNVTLDLVWVSIYITLMSARNNSRPSGRNSV